MPTRASVCETAYRRTLTQLTHLDYPSWTERLAAEVVEDAQQIPLYATPDTFSARGSWGPTAGPRRDPSSPVGGAFLAAQCMTIGVTRLAGTLTRSRGQRD